MIGTVAAVDLGATSGRVMLGRVGPNELSLDPVLRFPNTPRHGDGEMHWDIDELYRSTVAGLRAALRKQPSIRSIGIDAWAIDYALLKDGQSLGAPFHYRDDRSLAAVGEVHNRVSAAELYARNGLQHLSFSTLFQLTADRDAGRLQAADRLLLIPDLFAFWLTGRQVAERTNASTTGLLGLHSREWDVELIDDLDLPLSLFPELVDAGTPLGNLRPSVVEMLGGGERVTVTAVGSHDTASAVVAVPSTRDDFAYISCGTWGLVGVELDAPVLTEASRFANFTNEGGVDGRVRYLHNVMGLWLLSECVRTWEEEGAVVHLPTLLVRAAQVATPVPLFDANDPTFLAPGDMPARIATWCMDHGTAAPESPAEFVRSIIESLAHAFAEAVATATELSGKSVSVIHLVGGGSLNELLCQVTADRSGLPVLAGPVEATAIGNILIQARVQGLVTGSLESLRAVVAAAFPPIAYQPRVASVQP
ncbi:MAG: rhamnulokinase [Actinomycetota bacterium]|nr:rhamnulokinase [Actinomycetota bacterium]